MHEIAITENIENWRFERCPCGLCIATSPTGRAYWLRAKNPFIEILTPADREQALASACRVREPWAFRPRRPKPEPAPEPANQVAAAAPPEPAPAAAPKPVIAKPATAAVAPSPRLPNCFPSTPRGQRKVYIPPAAQTHHPGGHARR